MHRSELQRLFDERGIQPNKRLGQCFLIDENVSRWIADQLEPGADDVIIEVGPGAGALTRHLQGRGDRLVLVEKDRKLAEYLRDAYPEAEVIHQDATEFDLRPLFKAGPVHLIGNLPYSVGTEIMRLFLSPPTPVVRAVLMVQKEVAERICARSRSKAYGVLSLVLQLDWVPRVVKTIGSGPFFPQPEIASSVLVFEPRPADDLPRHCRQAFVELVKRGFSQRRKQLRKNLGIDPEEWVDATEPLSVPETARAEELSLEQWVELSNRLAPHPSAIGAQSGDEIFDVVDENDEVVGQASRAEVHREKKLHRAVHVFLFNRKGELFLQQRSLLKDSHPGKWDSSASGHLDSGEDYATAAARDLAEELMVTPDAPLERICKIPAGPETDWEFIEVYRGDFQKGKIRTHGNEIGAGAFFPVEEVAVWIAARPEDFATGFRTCFHWFREKGGLETQE